MVPIIVLDNGLRVANFSSPHSFNFATGEVLPGCTPERARRLMLDAQEVQNVRFVRSIQVTDIELEFGMSKSVRKELDVLLAREDIDIIIAPLPVLQACRGLPYMRKVRGIRVADRVTKAVHSDRFCV